MTTFRNGNILSYFLLLKHFSESSIPTTECFLGKITKTILDFCPPDLFTTCSYQTKCKSQSTPAKLSG